MKRVSKLTGIVSRPMQRKYLLASEGERQAMLCPRGQARLPSPPGEKETRLARLGSHRGRAGGP